MYAIARRPRNLVSFWKESESTWTFDENKASRFILRHDAEVRLSKLNFPDYLRIGIFNLSTGEFV